MLLAIDIGNTNITLGIFDNENLMETFRLPSDKELPQIEYELLLTTLFKNYNVTGCVVASVVEELTQVLKCAADNVFGVNTFVLTYESEHGLKLDLKNPSEVGADRLANAFGAMELYKLPAIVVDLGTATTFDIVSKNGHFKGGVIMPGLRLQLKSLNLNTSKLPRIEADVSEKAIGDSTESAILSGVIRGSASAIEGLINQCELELGEKACVIATGGYSTLISQYMLRQFDYVNPSLTLQGLRAVYEHSSVCVHKL